MKIKFFLLLINLFLLTLFTGFVTAFPVSAQSCTGGPYVCYPPDGGVGCDLNAGDVRPCSLADNCSEDPKCCAHGGRSCNYVGDPGGGGGDDGGVVCRTSCPAGSVVVFVGYTWLRVGDPCFPDYCLYEGRPGEARPYYCVNNECVACNVGPWTNVGCGGAGCSASMMGQIRTVYPDNRCGADAQCIADASCVPASTNTPTPLAGCSISSATFNFSSVSINVGSSNTFTFNVSANPSGCTTDASFSESSSAIAITSANPDTAEPFTVTVRCDGTGTATLTGRARVNGTIVESDTLTINCIAVGVPTSAPVTATPRPAATAAPTQAPTATPRPTSTPTPTPIPGCPIPRVKDPPEMNCGIPPLQGEVTWEWNDVNNVNQYELVIYNSGGLVQNYNWQNKAFYNCNGTTCHKTERRPAGSYRSRISAKNTNPLICTTSPTDYDYSNFVNVYQCSTARVDTPIILNGTGSYTTVWGHADPAVNFSIPPTPAPQMAMSALTPGVVSFTPASKAAPFNFTVTGLIIGETDYRGTITDKYGNTVFGTGHIEVRNPQPWTQAGAGDIVAASGNVSSPIPISCSLNPGCDPNLITYTTNENPGVVQASGSIDPGDGTISDPEPPFNLSVRDGYDGTRYDYAFFSKRSSGLPFKEFSNSSLTNVGDLKGSTYGGYYFAKYTGGSPLNIDADLNIGTDKIVLLVGRDLNIKRKINLTDGRGFLMVIVNGDINVDEALGNAALGTPDIQGLFFANDEFNSNANATAGDDKVLYVRGSVAANSFSITRNLPNNSALPAEYFEFAPDLLLQVPQVLGARQVIWREVQP